MSRIKKSRSITSRRARRRIDDQIPLNLTALLDAMVIILVFLLKGASVSAVHFSGIEGLELPFSSSPELAPETPQLLISPEALHLENTRILEFVQTADSVASERFTYRFKKSDLSEGGSLIVPLHEGLLAIRDNYQFLQAQAKRERGEPVSKEFFGELAIQADRRVDYDTLRKVMYTAASADFKIFHLLAIRKGDGG